MAIVHDLAGRINSLARLDVSGVLEDYLVDVAEANRGPADDLDRYPHHRYQVGRFARMAVNLFGVSLADAHAAACDALLPSTRRQTNLDLLEEYEARLDDEVMRSIADRKLQAAAGRQTCGR